MNNLFRLLISLVVLSLLVGHPDLAEAGQINAPIRQAETFRTNVTIPLENVERYYECPDEVIILNGVWHILVHSTIDASGGIHLSQKSNFQNVTGVGQDSGNEYRVVDVSSLHFNLSGSSGGATTATSLGTLLFIGKGRTPNFRLHVISHVTTNANDDITANFEQVRSECR